MLSEFQRRFTEALAPHPVMVHDDILRWKAFDNAPLEYFVRFIGDRACKVHCAKNKCDPALVLAFLSALTPAQLDAVTVQDPIGLFSDDGLRQTDFDVGVLVHSSLINGSLSKGTDRIRCSGVYTAFPAYRCEFPIHNPSYEATYRLERIIRWSYWTRPPAPALQAKFRLISGVVSADAEHFRVFRLDEIETVIADAIKSGGTVDVENFEGDVVRLEFANGNCAVVRGQSRRTMTGEASLEWVRIFTIEGGR